ncbi:Thioredoxin-like fold-containing protein [Dioscorea alata]|uniref:Thioredoxin-like fold-containing protein n=1 Tax=Dioscorea alata TaxID=55571 RepID=A0ACB7WEH3_DIOAL|nr:Thioredoxin-like fold-containing protein [Dioscorea alata]
MEAIAKLLMMALALLALAAAASAADAPAPAPASGATALYSPIAASLFVSAVALLLGSLRL